MAAAAAALPGGIDGEATLSTWTQRLDAGLAPWRLWIFGAKVTVAGLCALATAFWCGLDQPHWALVTAFTVSQPRGGAMLSKAFYRVLGSLAGAVAALTLVGLFAQERFLFLPALAAWMAACTFFARFHRDFEAYGFLLAGYTAAIIGIPGALAPDEALTIAIARVTEISIGILWATIVGTILLPERVGPALLQASRAARKELLTYLDQTLAPQRDPAARRRSRRRLATQAISCETLRIHAAFEDPNERQRGRAMRALNASVVHLAAHAEATAAFLDRLHPADSDARRPALLVRVAGLRAVMAGIPPVFGTSDRASSVAGILDAEAVTLRTAALTLLPASAAAPGHSGSAPQATDGAGTAHLLGAAYGRLAEFADAAALYARAAAALLGDRAALPPTWAAGVSHYGDPLLAGLAAIRVALAFLVLAGFWLLTAWPQGPGVLTLVALFLVRFSAIRRPQLTLGKLLLGTVLVLVPGFLTIFLVLPRLDSFIGLALAMSPILLVCGRLLGDQPNRAVGVGMILTFVGCLDPANVMTYDARAFFNLALGVPLSLLAAKLIFEIVLPDDAAFARRYLLRGIARELQLVATARLASPEPVETRLTELLNEFGAELRDDLPEDRRLMDGALAAITIGLQLVRLRELVPSRRADPALDGAIRRAALAVADACRGRRHVLVRAALDAALGLVVMVRGLAADPALPAADRARAATILLAAQTLHDELAQHADIFTAWVERPAGLA